MRSFRSRSNCVSKKSERKSLSGDEGSDFKSVENTSVGYLVQSSNDMALRMNDSEYQETRPRVNLLVNNKLDPEEEPFVYDVLAVDRVLSETCVEPVQMVQTVQENQVKEHGRLSDDSDTDYEEGLSGKESEEAGMDTKRCEDAEEKLTTMEPVSKVNDEKEWSRLSGSEEENDERGLQTEDKSYNISSKDKMILDLDQRDEGNSYAEREIYETQLVQLQRQLVETMIKEQETSEQLKKLENLKLDVILRELEEEKTKSSELADTLEFMKNKAKNSSLRRANASRRINRRSRVLETKDNQKERSLGKDTKRTDDDANQNKSDIPPLSPADEDTSAFDFDEGHFAAVTPGSITKENATAARTPSSLAKLQEYKKMILETIVDRLWDFVNEDAETAKRNSKDDHDDSDALSVITLKENINRCKSGAQPITHFVEPVIDIITWSRPVAAITTFLVYMFAVIHGYLLPLTILLVILQLSSNYFYASGIATKYGFKRKEEPPAPDEKKLTDRFQLVLQVAKKVQNTLEKVADSLEKIKNLLTWQHPVTKRLYIVLCFAFVASVLLDGPTLFMVSAVGIGVKLFIMRPIYSKFPKAKKRYDGLARIWNELPTDADLAKQEKKDFQFKVDAGEELSSPISPKLNYPCFVTSWANLCGRMKIPSTEYSVISWEDGHRCTLMTKDKPLTSMKQGKLFLTQNFLCFERYKFGTSKCVVIKLEEITNVVKYMPMNTMPGAGMSIKIEVGASNKPYIFGALLTRDELFESLISTCKSAKVPWACEGKY